MGSPTSVEFILWGPWMSQQNVNGVDWGRHRSTLIEKCSNPIREHLKNQYDRSQLLFQKVYLLILLMFGCWMFLHSLNTVINRIVIWATSPAITTNSVHIWSEGQSEQWMAANGQAAAGRQRSGAACQIHHFHVGFLPLSVSWEQKWVTVSVVGCPAWPAWAGTVG